ncbi:DUF4396 domain-containing protein [Thiocystis violacea]|uniref:DUF4396 domain-containing protein n=1 Tax=Thiocystis violacea TaxID=13725 RepID=UPI001904ADD1|nr:DUF4396 domain-containing protein [Thiocystis violacea]
MAEAVRAFLDSWLLIGLWALVVAASLAVLIVDLRQRNREIMGLMRAVWMLTVLYSGPLGLAVYWFSGRKQIPVDSIWRRGWRSVSHCYSGCGAGEIVGVLITAGLLALGSWPVAITTFALAYLFGYALTAGPLIQEGMPVGQALWDGFTSETASIFVMEVVAIGVDLWLAPNATLGQPLFWGSLVFSLICGLIAAWPVNVLLIRLGVKSGMHDPREMAAHMHGQARASA